ncbi:hypothetical protein Tco_0741605 [Tanacetum coccineum]
MHDPLEWRLYDTCGVHHVSTERGHEIFMLVEKYYPLIKGLTTLLLCIISKFGNNTYENTRIYKERTKKWHDSRLHGDKDFKVGDKVLLYNSRLKIYPGKLKSKWSGPNIVKMVYPHGAIEITDKDGVNFKVNGQRLKKYYGGNIDKEDDEVIVFENGFVFADCLYGVSRPHGYGVLTFWTSYLFLFFSTIDTAYLLNEYSVFDTCINIAYPGEPSERNDNVGGVFINLEILKCWSLEISRWLVNTLFAQELKLENHPEQHIRGVSRSNSISHFLYYFIYTTRTLYNLCGGVEN